MPETRREALATSRQHAACRLARQTWLSNWQLKPRPVYRRFTTAASFAAPSKKSREAPLLTCASTSGRNNSELLDTHCSHTPELFHPSRKQDALRHGAHGICQHGGQDT